MGGQEPREEARRLIGGGGAAGTGLGPSLAVGAGKSRSLWEIPWVFGAGVSKSCSTLGTGTREKSRLGMDKDWGGPWGGRNCSHSGGDWDWEG